MIQIYLFLSNRIMLMSAIILPSEIKKNLIILGIMGGICSGKSTVSTLLEKIGAIKLSADQIANQALQLPDVQQQIIAWWGCDLLESGQIQRKKLAKIVFGQATALKQLENLIHPIVRQTIQDQLIQLGKNFIETIHHLPTSNDIAKLNTAPSAGDDIAKLNTALHKPVVILDIPLLWESGWADVCNYLIFVDAALEIRQQRSISQRSWSAQEIIQREQHQASLEQKKNSAHFIVSNNGDLELIQQTIQKIWQKILS